MVGWAASVALFSFVMSVTPGPNNILLAASGLRFGVRRTIPQWVGICCGVVAMIGLCVAGLGAVFTAVPWLQLVLKIAGSLYLLWLGWHLWTSASLGEGAMEKPMGFWRAVGFQFVNPKAWVMTLTLTSAFLTPGPDYLWLALIATGVFVVVQAPSCGVWAVFGAGLRRWLSSPRALLVVNRCFAVAVVATIVLFWV